MPYQLQTANLFTLTAETGYLQIKDPGPFKK
jgi:hypothetical protein